jgi:hypothetical protein
MKDMPGGKSVTPAKSGIQSALVEAGLEPDGAAIIPGSRLSPGRRQMSQPVFPAGAGIQKV